MILLSYYSPKAPIRPSVIAEGSLHFMSPRAEVQAR